MVDRYHWMRQVTWAFEAIRKEEQKHLREAHAIKEWFYKVMDIKNACERKEKFKEWVCSVSESELIPFQKCAQTYSRWLTGILNSFDVPFTNGFTEGCNNKIKVLKRNAYGYRRFDRFRNRILHMFSHQMVA